VAGVGIVEDTEFGFFGGHGAGYTEDLGEGREGDGFLPDGVRKAAVDGRPLGGAHSSQTVVRGAGLSGGWGGSIALAEADGRVHLARVSVSGSIALAGVQEAGDD